MTTPKRDAAPEQTVHRALASPVRARLLEVLQAESDLDATALGQRLGLHVNTVRTHLNLLEEAGLIDAYVEDRNRPGRPRRLYRRAADESLPGPRSGEDGYRFLARILASYLDATSDDVAAAAERAGHAWGRFVVDAPAPLRTPGTAETVTQLVDLLDRLGFAPQLAGTDPANPQIVLRRCPFVEVAREHQDVVCAVHLGLMRGALEEYRLDIEVRDLVAWAAPDACIAQLRLPSLPAVAVE